RIISVMYAILGEASPNIRTTSISFRPTSNGRRRITSRQIRSTFGGRRYPITLSSITKPLDANKKLLNRGSRHGNRSRWDSASRRIGCRVRARRVGRSGRDVGSTGSDWQHARADRPARVDGAGPSDRRRNLRRAVEQEERSARPPGRVDREGRSVEARARANAL